MQCHICGSRPTKALVCSHCGKIAAYLCDGFVCDPKLWATKALDPNEPLSCIPLMNLRCECGAALNSRGVKKQPPLQRWCENGAYLVMGPQGAPNKGAYRSMLKDMLSCTFPVTGDVALTKALCPGYSSEGRHHYLVSTYASKGYSFLFLPRHFYLLLYHVYVTTVEKGHSSEGLKGIIETLGMQDARMIFAFRKSSSLVSYFAECIEQLVKCSGHFAEFNHWALQQVADYGCVNKLNADGINLAVPQKLLEAVVLLSKCSKLTAPQQEAIIRLVKLEIARPECAFLTRFGKSSKGIYPTLKEESAQNPSAPSFSQSFGADVFAGFFGDKHASTLGSIGGKNLCFAVPINIDDYRLSRPVAGCFIIPPYPSPCQCYQGMNELWHPRSRIFLRSEVDISEQEVRGITEYGIQIVKKDWSGEIETIPFMFYAEKLTDVKIIQLSIAVEAYVSTYAIVLSKAS